MPTFTSPGVYFVEQDFSEYAPSISSTIPAVIGYASKGPIDKPTLITSAKQLVDTFGRPDQVNDGEHTILGALEILKKTNTLYYIRPSDGSATQATASLRMGSCPGIGVAAPTSPEDNYAMQVSSVIDSGGTEKLSDPVNFTFAGGATAGAFLTNLRAAADGVTSDISFFTMEDLENSTASAAIVGFAAGISSRVHCAISSGTVVTSSNGVSNILTPLGTSGEDVGFASSVTASGTLISATALAFDISGLTKGAGFNASTDAAGNQTGAQVSVTSQAGPRQLFSSYNDGSFLEAFDFNWDGATASSNNSWIQDILTSDEDTTKSDLLLGSFVGSAITESTYSRSGFTGWFDKLFTNSEVALQDGAGDATSGNPFFPKLISSETGTKTGLTGGTNGDDLSKQVSSYTGAAHSANRTGIYALQDDSLNISMACIPGVSNQTIQNDLVSLAESTEAFLAIINPPESLTPQEAVSWHNGTGSLRTNSLNSSFAAIYYPWLQIFNTFDGVTSFVTPDVYAIATMCHTDSVSDPWFAPAGVVRGRLTKPLDVQYILNAGDRQVLYSGGNVINPISKFVPDGIVIYGQRTAQRAPSALDRINVRRMMILLRKTILAATQTFVFEPNDPLTWTRVTDTINPLLDDITRRRGITDFKVVCDETTNTPLRIDRNELWCQVRIKPTKTAEIIIFEVNITSQSASI